MTNAIATATVDVLDYDDAATEAVEPMQYSPASLREALATVDAAKGATEGASAYLKELVLMGYRTHAEKLGRTHPGTDELVIPSTVKKELTLRLWLDAGSADVVKVADRTPGQRSFATYLSELNRVATDADYGVTWLSSWETVDEATEQLRDAAKAEKEAAELVNAAAAESAWLAFKAQLPTADQKKLEWVESFFLGTSVAQSHAAVYAAGLITAS